MTGGKRAPILESSKHKQKAKPMTRIMPFVIIALTVVLIAPLAVDYIAGLTLDMANDITTQMGR